MANDLEGGVALAAWLTASTVMTELVRMGIIPSHRAVEMTDHALLVLERGLKPTQDKLRERAHPRGSKVSFNPCKLCRGQAGMGRRFKPHQFAADRSKIFYGDPPIV